MEKNDLERFVKVSREKNLSNHNLDAGYVLYDDNFNEIMDCIHDCAKNMKSEESIMEERKLDVNDIIELTDIDFVQALYRRILLREPDEEGETSYVAGLLRHLYTRKDLIKLFSESEEGKVCGVEIEGLDDIKENVPTKQGKVRTYIRYIIRWVKCVLMLPRKIVGLQKQLEEHSALIYEEQRKTAKLERQLANMDQNEKYVTELMNREHQQILEEEEEQKLLDKFYVTYNEMLFTETREQIKDRKNVYIEKLNVYFEGKEKSKIRALDLGCGTCEWVEVLSYHGYDAYGVDGNKAVVEKVRKIYPYLHIELGEAMEHLKTLPDNSIDIISSFHMVEHIGPYDLMKLLKECKRVLRKDGILIIETPNPLNILVATYYFNLDPTHKKIIPVELLEVYVKNAGFVLKERVMVYPLNFTNEFDYKQDDPISQIVFRFNMEQAYSVLAVNK